MRTANARRGFAWAGASTTVATHDPQILRDLADLTGLEPVPLAIRLGRAELNALPETTGLRARTTADLSDARRTA